MIVVASSPEEFAAIVEGVLRRVLAQAPPPVAGEPGPSSGGRNRSIRDAAREAGVSVSTVRRRIRSGDLQTIRIGQRVLIPASEVEKLKTPSACTSPR